MTNYQRGVKKERKLIDKLRRDGYTVVRSTRSLSPVDIVAFCKNSARFIQCKRVRKIGKNTILVTHFREEIEELQKLGVPPYSFVELWVWVDYKGWTMIYSKQSEG